MDYIRIYRGANGHKHTLVVVEKADGSEREFTVGRHTSERRIRQLAKIITPRKSKGVK